MRDRPVTLELYLAGGGGIMERARRNATNIVEALGPDLYTLQVVDVLQSPELAVENRIIATPTLLRKEPLPLRRIVGDFADTESICSLLRSFASEDGGEG